MNEGPREPDDIDRRLDELFQEVTRQNPGATRQSRFAEPSAAERAAAAKRAERPNARRLRAGTGRPG